MATVLMVSEVDVRDIGPTASGLEKVKEAACWEGSVAHTTIKEGDSPKIRTLL